VEAVGTNVTRLQPGAAVFGIGEGSFAEYVRAHPDKLAPKPANLSFEQAAAVPISGLTALQALRDTGQVQPGQQVLIIGAAGGVGSFAVQVEGVRRGGHRGVQHDQGELWREHTALDSPPRASPEDHPAVDGGSKSPRHGEGSVTVT
jgi:NADPH:quinone reductase-like Zn-dependent oxidoreductase